MRRSFWWAAMIGLSCYVAANGLFAQDRGDRDREERRGRDEDRGSRGPFGGGERGPGGYGDRGPGGYGERGPGGYGERGPSGYGERGPGGYGDRGPGGYGDRGSYGDRGGFGDRGSFGGDRGYGGGYGERRFDPTEIFRRMDQNGNGQLEPSEVSERGRRFVADAASKAGLDPSQPLAIDRLVAGYSGQSTPPAPATPVPTTTSSSSSSGSKTEVAPLIPGFGVALSLTPPPGFDVPLSRSSNRFQRPLEERFEKAVIDRVNDILRQMDTNKDGKIEYAGDEGKNNRWQGDPKASDLNSDGKLDREELCIRIAKLTGSRERSEDEGRSGERGDRGSDRGSRGGSSSGESEDPKAKVRRYAESLMRRHDENRSGQLEKDEIAKMSSDSQKADLNNDGVITLDELIDKLGSFGSEGPGGGGPPGMAGGPDSSRRGGFGGRSRGGEGSGSSRYGGGGNGGGTNGAIRFLTDTERLPKGLPTWFLKNDVNGDGQVSMAEYSSTWNDTVLAEFTRYDLNSDGTITPQECLQGEKDRMARR